MRKRPAHTQNSWPEWIGNQKPLRQDKANRSLVPSSTPSRLINQWEALQDRALARLYEKTVGLHVMLSQGLVDLG
jgi:hypothetical protein